MKNPFKILLNYLNSKNVHSYRLQCSLWILIPWFVVEMIYRLLYYVLSFQYLFKKMFWQTIFIVLAICLCLFGMYKCSLEVYDDAYKEIQLRNYIYTKCKIYEIDNTQQTTFKTYKCPDGILYKLHED